MLKIKPVELDGQYYYKVSLLCTSPVPLELTTLEWKIVVRHISSALVRHLRNAKKSYKGLHFVPMEQEEISREETEEVLKARRSASILMY